MRRFRILVAVLAATLAACGDDDDPAAAVVTPPPAGPSSVRVMTQNLFLGADLDLLLAPGASLFATVEALWASVLATDFEARAAVVAEAIQANDADVVGLQEVSLWRFQAPGDRGTTPNAATVQADFLEILLRALAARGLSYRVVGSVTNADLELPGAIGNDYRLTDRDVIIAKSSLPITAAGAGTFPHLATLTLPSPIPGFPLQATVPRGWVAAELRAGGRTIKVFNVHLEAFSPEIATQQVQDLLAVANPAAQPTIVLGDINLPPGTAGYGLLAAPATRLRDAWAALRGDDPGLTCCWNPDLRGGDLETRVDVVFATTELRPTAVTRVNETARTPGGLSPSDHLGVVATFDAGGATTAVAAAR